MVSRTLANLGLKGGYADGDNGWGMDQNANLLKLSVLVQGGVISRLAAVPGSPADGDIYLLTGGANANSVAAYDNGAWSYFVPTKGWLLYDRDAEKYVTFDGDSWEELATGGGGGGGGGVEEAPMDGTRYARRDGQWVTIPTGGGGGGAGFEPCAVIQHAVGNAGNGESTANLAVAPTAGNFIVLVSTGWQATKSWSPAGFATVCAQYVANNSTQIAIKRADGTEGTQFRSFGQDRNNLTVYEIEAPDAIGIGGGPLSVAGNTWIIPSFQLNGQPSTTFVGIETDNFSALSYTDGPAASISDYIPGNNHSGLHFVVTQDDFTEFKGQMASVNNPIAGYLQVAKRV